MRYAAAYAVTQSITMDGNRAFEELYVRLARWTAEAGETAEDSRYGQLIDKCVSLLGYMDPLLDPSRGGRIALNVLSLHRFAITTLIQAKRDGNRSALDGLPETFYSLAEVFKAVHDSAARSTVPTSLDR